MWEWEKITHAQHSALGRERSKAIFYSFIDNTQSEQTTQGQKA